MLPRPDAQQKINTFHYIFPFWKIRKRKQGGWGWMLVRTEPVEAKPEQLPIQRMLLLARQWQKLLEQGNITRAELAEEYGCSRPRVTQILNLLKLATGVQELILSLDLQQVGERSITERALRRLIERPPDVQYVTVMGVILGSN